jgi:hypothetical protein
VSENGNPEQDRLARLLRDEGPAQAPGDLAADVMRQVRAEPRRRPRRWLPSLALPAAAAVALVAGVIGVSRIDLGTGSSSSAASSAARGAANGGGTTSSAPETAPSVNGTHGAITLQHVPSKALAQQAGTALVPCPANSIYALRVPVEAFAAVSDKLSALARSASPSGHRVEVRVTGDASAKYPTLTCR